MNRVVVVSTFYETKLTADEQLSFIKNDQQVNRSFDKLNGKLMFDESRNQVAKTIFSLFIQCFNNTYVVLLISDIDIKGSD